MSWRLLKSMNRWLPKNSFGDYIYASALFYKVHGRLPNGSQDYNDCLFRIKTNKAFRTSLRARVSDKEHVKAFVESVLGPGHCIPTLAVLTSREAIQAYPFPDRCCIKPTHMSGEVILRHHGEPIDRQKIQSWLESSYYYAGRETNYRGLEPKVIVEPLVFDRDHAYDYKVFCYRGEPRLIQVDVDRFSSHRRLMYDTHWTLQNFRYGEPAQAAPVSQPHNLPEMLKAAAAIAAHFDFIRVDFYTDGDRFLIGELTSCPCNCTSRFYPTAAETTMGRLIFGD